MNSLEQIISDFNSLLWSDVLMVLLLAGALWFTFQSRFVSFRKIPEMLRLITQRDTGRGRHVSSFQAFIVSLAGRVGTGNLAGVATAIAVGGPGAVFWMWIIALLGSAIAFFECTLAQLYKRRNQDSFIGGPAYYMLYGNRMRGLAVFFALLSAVCFGVAYNSVHSNTICAAVEQAFDISSLHMGLILFVGTLLTIFGGIHRIAKVSSVIVPIMATGYILIALAVMLINITALPDMFAQIFQGAFGWHQAVGGGIGATLSQGIRRGLYSNEAGMGTSPNVAATATVTHPIKQGLIQSMGVFVDTLIICSSTAFIILLGGQYGLGSFDGIQLTQVSLQQEIGSVGSVYIAVTVLLFAFSTILSNYYYGESNLRFFTHNRVVLFIYRILAACVVLFGAVTSLQTAWNLADIAMGLMTLCNLFSMFLLTRPVMILFRDYMRQKREGRDPVYVHREGDGVPGEVECWKE